MLKVKNVANSGNYYALFELDGRIGTANLEEGFNDQLKIESVGHGSDPNYVTYESLRVGDDSYGIVIGANTSGELNKISIQIEFELYSYNVDVSNNNYFIDVHKMPDGLEKINPAIIKY
ncbi:hypothetical protein [Aureibacillus halotolerans]|uniref:Uncharacterized protein n=1 Tax=Aureibacillus halotolerans TaxID=1508390 RepID=A0A4V3D3X4_9BACI|nr:hypothetical protein [Aureibacillus halotolerans]TDQ32151.1 hypothetical protein EV213_13314 [Aureibacillus halotolerans]